MTSTRETLIGGIEAGGTKFLCAVADQAGHVREQTRIPTTSPKQTLAAVQDFFRSAEQRHGSIACLGVGSFGPLSLKHASTDFGSITATPKPAWSGTQLVSYFEKALSVPVVLDTDVNCAAVGELLFGSGRGLDCFCYITVGTGVGVGVMIGARPHIAMSHPEAGHIRVPHAPGDHAFAGTCPYHGDCLEGLASGPAMRSRWGTDPAGLPDGHPAWEIEANYIAGLCANLTYIVRPERIILGGGVMERSNLLALIRNALRVQLAGYDACASGLDLDRYIVPASAGSSAGLTGALAIAYRCLVNEWPWDWTPSDQAKLTAARS